jgi:hypothetical protein
MQKRNAYLESAVFVWYFFALFPRATHVLSTAECPATKSSRALDIIIRRVTDTQITILPRRIGVCCCCCCLKNSATVTESEPDADSSAAALVAHTHQTDNFDFSFSLPLACVNLFASISTWRTRDIEKKKQNTNGT